MHRLYLQNTRGYKCESHIQGDKYTYIALMYLLALASTNIFELLVSISMLLRTVVKSVVH